MPDPHFADRLLAADSVTSRRPPADGVDAVLGPTARWGGLLAALAALGVTGLLVYLAAVADGLADPIRSPFQLLCLMSAGVTGLSAGLMLWMIWKGTARKPRSNAGAVGFAAGYLALTGGVALSLAGHVPTHPDVRVFGGLAVVGAAALWVRSRVAQAESATAERLLELELRLAEMQDAMRGQAS